MAKTSGVLKKLKNIEQNFVDTNTFSTADPSFEYAPVPPADDTEPESDPCPPGYVYDETLKQCVPDPNYQNPFKYLYEPNLAILKSGAFKTVALRFELEKLGPHTHLYTSTKKIENFPGKTYCIDEILPYKKADIRKRLKGIKANLKIRNYPQTVAQIKKDFNTIDGGNQYIFFTSTESEKQVLLCSKLNPTKI